MHIEALAKQPSAHNQINWVTAFFMVAFHIGAVGALFRSREQEPFFR